MGEVIATVNGVPLDVVLDEERSAEIKRHLRQEQSSHARECGLRRCSTPRSIHMGHPGRPARTYSVLLMGELEPYLRDESLPSDGIADLFGISPGELHAYKNHLGICRRRGRKPGVTQVTQIVKVLP
jgi:hypothetical protein